MFNRRMIRALTRSLLFILLAAILSACSLAVPAERSTSTPAVTVTLDATATPTLTPTDTPQPPLVILVAAPQADAGQKAVLELLFSELSAQAGLRFQLRPGLAAADLDESVKIVAALPPDPGLASLAATAPGVQFLGVGIPNLEPAENLSVIGGDGSRPDQQAFIAGYMAAAITSDWRVGMIAAQDAPTGLAARQAFVNGAIFFCGLCRPSYPPFYQYPQYAELSLGASQADKQAAADYLIDRAAETVFIVPELEDEALVDYLTQNGVNVIGSMIPPASVQNRWVASIRPDLDAAVREIWENLLANQGGTQLQPPLVIEQVNESLLSPGRQRLVEQTLTELLDGFIGTGAQAEADGPPS